MYVLFFALGAGCVAPVGGPGGGDPSGDTGDTGDTSPVPWEPPATAAEVIESSAEADLTASGAAAA